MRKVYIGKFADYKPAEYDYDYGLIGGHRAARYYMERTAKTISLEYYVKDKDGRNIMIKDATILEKVLARIKYVFNSNGGKVVGYRSTQTSDVLTPGYSLGRKRDDKGKWRVDKEYYESRGYSNGKKLDPKTGVTRVAPGAFEQGDEPR